MAFQTAAFPSDSYVSLRNQMPQLKSQAQLGLSTLQAGSVDADWVFRLLDITRVAVSNITTAVAVSGLDAFAVGQGYSGSMVSDANAVSAAATSCISWVTTNFPSAGGFIQDRALNADGSRTARSFTSGQTAGLQSALSSLIASIQ